MLSESTIALVKSTVPVLANAGVEVTNHFYQRMFKAQPELQHIFNMSNQASGKQQFALFSAVAAYATHIDQLDQLGELVERVAHKHTSYFVQPEHYDIVGHHLIETLKELAPDTFTPDVVQAWQEAYALLANILTGRETELYSDFKNKQGGWYGPKAFRVAAKTPESELVTSFTLVPEDGDSVADYLPGQYLGIRVQPPGAEYTEIRQYSLSDKPQRNHYRISVKRETGEFTGTVSNHLHDNVQVGDTIDALPPAGAFFLQDHTDSATPVVLISAGVGLTPMLSMLETVLEHTPNRPVCYLHACENAVQHSFKTRVNQLCEQHDSLSQFCWYNKAQSAEKTTESASDLLDDLRHGLMNISDVKTQLPIGDGQFYLCGPTGFMGFIKRQLMEAGVAEDRIFYEVFGPHSDL